MMKSVNFKTLLVVFSFSLVLIACGNDSTNDANLPVKEEILAEKEEVKLPTVNIKANEKLVSPTEIKVNSQGVWFASEGTLGYVELMDEKGHKLSSGILTTTEKWMTSEPVIFSTNLSFDPKESTRGTLIVHNHPGEGDGNEAGEKVAFKIPITF